MAKNMKYISISKVDGSEEIITRKKALEDIKVHYRNPEYVLEHAERLFGNRIGLTFSVIEVRE